MTIKMIPCVWCRHLMGDRTDGNFCDAFPAGDGIPRAIILGEVDHRDPYPGDGGVRFEPRAGAPELSRVGGLADPILALADHEKRSIREAAPELALPRRRIGGR